MRARCLHLVFAALAAITVIAGPARSHGCVYGGPGGYGGRNGLQPGGSSSGGDSVPPPSTPGPGGPRSGGGGSPTGPAVPQPPRTGGSSGVGTLPTGAGNPGMPTTFGEDGAVSAVWETWWRHHGESYLPPLRSRSGLDDGIAALDLDAVAREQVLPALAELVASSTSNEVRAAAMIATAKLGAIAKNSSELRERIQPHLAAPNQELAESAAVALGLLGDRGALDVLREAMIGDGAALRKRGIDVGSVTERTRAFAAYGLGLLGQRVSHVERSLIIATLVQWFDTEAARAAQAELSTACIVALSQLPLPMDARRAVHGDWPSGRPTRVDSLDAQILWLVDRLGDRSLPNQVRAQAPTAIARLAADTPQRHWLRSLAVRECAVRLAQGADEPLEVQFGCVLALGTLGDAGGDSDAEAVRRALGQAIAERRDPTLAALALISLGKASARPGAGAEPWKSLLDERGPRGALLAVVRDEKSADRSSAAIGLALLERGVSERGGPADARSLEALRAALADARTPERISAVSIALGLVRDRRALEELRSALSRARDPGAQGFLALSLGMLGDSAGVPALEDLLRRSRFQPAVVQPVSRALAMLGAPKAEDVLLQLLSEAGSGSSKAVIALGLANAGGKGSIPRLLAEIHREGLPEPARAIAVAALGRIVDPRERPWISAVSECANAFGAAPSLASPRTGDGLVDLL